MLRVFALGLLLPPAASAFACPENRGLHLDVWHASVERTPEGQAVRRFIPPELYSGASWNGERTIVLRPMRETRKPAIPADHPAITIEGPLLWPGDQKTPVIRRIRHSRRQGKVEQYFRINERGDGLGRVEDQRAGRSRPEMAECFKFPLGWWKAGEERTCGNSTIRILDLDFEYQGMAHALRFDWNGESTYVFVPQCGLTAVTH